jgi:hypothetical protein
VHSALATLRNGSTSSRTKPSKLIKIKHLLCVLTIGRMPHFANHVIDDDNSSSLKNGRLCFLLPDTANN